MKSKVIMSIMLTLLMSSVIVVSASSIHAIAQTNSTTTVYLYPPTINGTAIGVNNTVTVNIMIRDAHNIYAWQAGLTFNPELLECTGFFEGEFLSDAGSTSWIAGTINNTAGVIRPFYGCTLLGEYWASGDGRLAYATFKVKAPGVSDIHLSDVEVIDYDLTTVLIKIINIYTAVLDTIPHTVVMVSNLTGATREYVSGFYDHAFNLALEEISFKVAGPYTITDASGIHEVYGSFSNVTIPKTLLNVSTLDEWIVVIDGLCISRTVTENATHTSICFTYTAGIHEVRVTTRPLIRSSISIALSSTAVTLGSSVTMSGAIDPVRSDVTVTILYRPRGGTWTTLATVQTDSNSHYSYTWTPSETGTYEVKARWKGDLDTLGAESDVQTLTVQEFVPVLMYTRTYLSNQWITGGVAMGWHADDASWPYTLPFEFPFYGTYYRTIYISSNGLITFIGPDTSCSNSIERLVDKLAIAPAWDDWTTEVPWNTYIWQPDPNQVIIRWEVAALYNTALVANFQVILTSDGVIQFNYGYNNGPISATVGISNGIDEILAEDITTSNYIQTIVFTPFRPEHELAVALDALAFLVPSDSSLLNATVYNLGLSNETDVELQLLINGSVVDSVTISELVNGTSYTLSHIWTPTVEATYNVTAYTPPVSGENITVNNRAIKFVVVTYPLINPIEGQWANYTLSQSDTITGELIVTGQWGFTYVHYVSPYLINVTMWSKYPEGYIIAGWMVVNIMDRMVETDSGIYWAGMWYPGWIETNITLGSRINLLQGTATVVGSRIIGVDGYPVDCWELRPELYEYEHTFRYDKASGLWVGMESTVDHYHMELKLVATNIPIGVKYDHELAVALGAPSRLEPGESSLLNATVYNVGLRSETDVELQLLINGSVVDSVTIPTLVNGTSYTFSYLWTPNVEAMYNVTAYAPLVLGENVTANNIATKIVRVKWAIGYVLFDQTHGTDSIASYSTWAANLTERGYVVDTHTYGPITSSVLADYDVFVIPQAHDYYSPDEVSAIQDFVLNGGGLLVIGDDEPYIYTGLTGFAGISWDWDGYGGHTSDITSHLVTEGVNTAYFGSPVSMLYVTSPAIDLIRDSYGYVMLAVSEVEAGKVIGIADEDSLRDYSIVQAANLRLANNIIDWLTLGFPVASFTYSPIDSFVGETVTFDASASYDSDGTIVSYEWDFGDGATGSGITTTHAYTVAGTYTVTLNVTDDDTLTDTCTKTVTVSRVAMDVEVDVGSVHFRGEMAEFYVLTSVLGEPVDAYISAILYHDGTLHADLSASVEHVAKGLYRVPYTIPTEALTGTYVLVVEASYLTLKGTSLKSFLLSPTLTGTLIYLNGTVAWIKTEIGIIEGRITSIDGSIATIETDVGTIKTMLEGWTGGTTSPITTPLGDFQVLVLTTSTLEGPITFSDNTLTISLSGQSGITGTTNVVIPKRLLSGIQSSIDKVVVTIDDEKVIFTYTENPEAYVLRITNTHSTHLIKIYLEGLPPTPFPAWAVLIIVLLVAVATGMAFYTLKIRKPRVTSDPKDTANLGF